MPQTPTITSLPDKLRQLARDHEEAERLKAQDERAYGASRVTPHLVRQVADSICSQALQAAGRGEWSCEARYHAPVPLGVVGLAVDGFLDALRAAVRVEVHNVRRVYVTSDRRARLDGEDENLLAWFLDWKHAR